MLDSHPPLVRVNLLLIRGLGHSGTTILDLALGSHPAITGLGEAIRILECPRPGEESKGPAQLRGELRHQRRCTCGQLASDCPVWGPVLDWLPANDGRPIGEKLGHLLNALAASPQGSALRWVVDSYQADLLAPQLSWSRGEIRCLFLVRDVRSWVHSRTRNREDPLAACMALARWMRTNRQVEAALRRSGRPVFVLGYEELALAPEASLRRICDWLGLSFDAAMLSPGPSSSSHILAGNRMRFDADRAASIRYDASWMARGGAAASIAAALPPVRGMNRRLVYGNGLL
jgi:hypothetical protein